MLLDTYVEVEDGANEVPPGAVRAMHRQLHTTDKPAIDSYVALWRTQTHSDGGFGRAGRVGASPFKHLRAWFPLGNYEREPHTFKLLVDRVPDSEKGFCYVWVPLYKARENPDFTPVEAPNSDGCSPAVTNVYAPDGAPDGKYLGEVLGKAMLNPAKIQEWRDNFKNGQIAWRTYYGQAFCHTGIQYEQCYVLCRKNLPDF